ncbi:MAG: hypothetical protein B7C24_02545 [Bacteroidetes bacterium 4572_77]|nr:MAG: hypothetical protein B7C24_02545 [Bacteroidetes bacterium 4572_77]
MITLIIALVIAPLMALAFFVFMKYRFPKAHFGLFNRSYFWGIFSTLFAIVIYLLAYWQGYLELKNLRRIIFFSFFIIGFGQELGKFLVLRYLFLPTKKFTNPSDGIIYSFMINFGALTIFNIIAVLIYPESDPSILITRSFVSIVYAVILGFFHGSFEFILQTNDHLLLWPFIIGSAIITFLLIVKAMQITDEMETKE